MSVSPQGDVASGSFYALDPTVIPWDLTNPIYQYAGVTLIVSNFNATTLSSTSGTNVTSSGTGLAQYRVILIVQGVQRNAPAIVSDIQSIFGMPAGSFTAQVSNPLTIPVSIFASNFTTYSNFANKFAALTSPKPAMVGKYSSSLLQTSSSALIFNSLESLTYPISPALSPSSIASAALGLAISGATFAPLFGLNSTGVLLFQKKVLNFSLGQDHTLTFGSLLGVTGVMSATNETFVASMPDGAQVKSFSPANMLVQSGSGSTLVIGAFPWVGTAQRLLPDVTVTFHYPAFDSPVLTASWATTPSTYNVGQPFSLTLNVTNTGMADAKSLYFTLNFNGVVLSAQPTVYSLKYSVASLPKGATDTRAFNFQSYSPNEPFTLGAYYLDTQNYVYQWSTQFSPGPTVKQNGPLTVTKMVAPANPSYGQIGNITLTINNPSSSTYYNMEDLDPLAQIFLYPSGFGNNPSEPQPCPGLANIFSPITANATYFTFQLENGARCTPTVLTHVLLQPFGQTMQLVASPNILLGSNETWSPVKPYLIPGGPATLGEQLTLQLTFRNYSNITSYGQVTYSTPLPQQENPKTTYLGLYCSPCTLTQGGTTTISGALANATGAPLLGQPVTLSYKFSNNTVKPVSPIPLITNATGGFSYPWMMASQLPIGNYQLIANYTGSAQNNKVTLYFPFSVEAPTTISPGGTITLSYPYFFNVTGIITLPPERMAYSGRVNATGTDKQLVSEYMTESSTVTVTVGAPTILPVVDSSMNVTRFSVVYVAQNQSLVQVNLRVTNTGPQTATNILVSSMIPEGFSGSNHYWLPVTSTGPGVTVAGNLQTVTFSVAFLSSGQAYSTWYVVRANSTNLFVTASNVTAQSGPSRFQFHYLGPVLGVYPAPSSIKPPKSGFLQAYTTISPAVVANNTATVVTLHLYNAGNVTYNSINASISNYLGSQLKLPTTSKTVPNMAPGTSQAVNFTASAAATSFFAGTTSTSLTGTVSYNQSSTLGFKADFNLQLLIYDPAIPSLNPSLKVDISAPTPQVSAGATDLVIVTVTNTGLSNETDFYLNLQAYSPLFNPTGPMTPQTSYGSSIDRWPYNLLPGQNIKFRVGIQTTSGGLYPVFATQVYYGYYPPGWTITQSASIDAATAPLITAVDTTPPTINPPWSSPFAPTSSEQVHIWAQVYDGSGISSVYLEYSTDRLRWTSVPMNSLFATYVSGQGIPLRPFFGDIYNTTLPALGPGAAVFYRVRTTDIFGNTGVQDNSGNDYVYFIQGGPSWLFPNTSPGTNTFLNPTQYNSAVKTTLTLNVSTPIAVQLVQLPSNPGGSPPSGMTSIGLYTQVNANLSVTLDARIRFYYNSSQIQGLDPNTVTPYYWDGANWIALSNIARNPGQNYVEGTVHHFSLFGVFASTATNPPAQPTSQSTWLYIAIGVAAAIGAVTSVIVAKKRKPHPASLVPVSPSNPTFPQGGS